MLCSLYPIPSIHAIGELAASLPYLGMVKKFGTDDPHFFGFLIELDPYIIPQHDLIGPLFLQKQSVCLYHIYFQRYSDQFFTKMYYLTV